MIERPAIMALLAILALAVASWFVSVLRKDVSFVDSLWSLFFVVAATIFALSTEQLSSRASIVLLLVMIWALRLSIHITVRNWRQPEDYRYRSIRANNEPGFAFKSLYIVFGLQAVLAWLVALPLWPSVRSDAPLAIVDGLAVTLWVVGFVFEAVGDYQLKRFKGREENRGRVLDTGLWKYTRHPNYFGEFCIWWSFYLFAVAAGGWWSIASPLLMSLLLLKVSGVAMLENTIADRRPEYAAYQERTSSFFPKPPAAKHPRSIPS